MDASSPTRPLHQPINFRELLIRRAGSEELKKSVQTRMRLLASACVLLEKVSYSDLKIGDICTHAKMSHGIAYHYYKDKSELVSDLLVRFTQEIFEGYSERPELGTNSSPYLRIFDANAYYFRCIESNPGVFATLFRLRGELPAAKNAVQDMNNAWNRRVGQSIKGDFKPPLTGQERVLLGHALGGMADDLLGQIYAIKNPDLKAPRTRTERRRLCELLSILWYRAVYARHPDPDVVAAARELF
jgi:AcrR family transcriptional regulator